MNENASIQSFLGQLVKMTQELPIHEARLFLRGFLLLTEDREEVVEIRSLADSLGCCDDQLQLLVKPPASDVVTPEAFTVEAKKRLVERDMTTTDLAKRLGLSRGSVSMAINNTVFPTVRRRIADELGMKLA